MAAESKLLKASSMDELERKINQVISDRTVLSISHQTVVNGHGTYFQATLLLEKESERQLLVEG